jgi:Rrf2 family protein
MQVSQKAQYALRATFELARNAGRGPIKAAAIARAQAIPLRFLEIILHELRRAGFVQSRRGCHGGYVLLQTPAALSVGEIISFVEGPTHLVDCGFDKGDGSCPLASSCVFKPLWEKVRQAVAGVYGSTTFQDLLDWEEKKDGKPEIHYSI